MSPIITGCQIALVDEAVGSLELSSPYITFWLDFVQNLSDNTFITATPPIPLVGDAHIGWLFSFKAAIPQSAKYEGYL